MNGKGGAARYQKDQKKRAEAPFLSGFYSALLLFFLRLKATPNPAAVIEPRIVSGSGTAAAAGLYEKVPMYVFPFEVVRQISVG